VTGFYRARQQFGARLCRLREEAGVSGKHDAAVEMPAKCPRYATHPSA